MTGVWRGVGRGNPVAGGWAALCAVLGVGRKKGVGSHLSVQEAVTVGREGLPSSQGHPWLGGGIKRW